MAVPDDTALKALINSNIPDANPGLPRRATATFVRAALFTLIDWVKTAINSNLSTWYKLGTTSAPLTNADDIYRAGRVFVGRTNDDGSGAALQANTFSLYGVPFLGGTGMMPTETTDFDTLNQVGTYCIGGSVWGTGMHAPGNTFTGVFTFGTLIVSRSSAGSCTQMYLDNAQSYIYLRHKWASNSWGAWVCTGRPLDMAINSTLSFDAVTTNKKIQLYPAFNDHQFYGFGVNPSALRYQIGDAGGAHVFYTGLTPATSLELLRFQGNGVADFASLIRVKTSGVPSGGVGLELHYGAVPNTSSIISYDRATSTYKDFFLDGMKFAINGGNPTAGTAGAGTLSPTSTWHVKGPTGHQQFRLETDYTPTSSSDPNGQIGQVCFDANYCYKKSAAGWKRSPIFTTF